jgi:hypothetical protein
MKKTLAALALAAAFAVPTLPAVAAQPGELPADATKVSPATAAIIGAGQLRLQSQRLAKLWLQSGLGITAGAATSLLAKGTAQFERDLALLQKQTRNDATQRSLLRVAELWRAYRQALALPYNGDNLKAVNYLADDLMLATGKLALQVESEADGATGRLLDLSLRQSMLAQRLARLYLLAQAGDRSSGRLVDIEQARQEFATALRELAAARENTPASREALELARVQWLFFEQAISELGNRGNAGSGGNGQGGASNGRPQHVASSSERILEVLDEVSRQYAQDYGSARLAANRPAASRN